MPAEKLQSAMEYLMTYGWAILIIAVVLGVLYQLGVFGSGQSVVAPGCIVSPGYICGNPVLNTTGYLGFTFGQIGTSLITLTGIACTANSTTPSITQFLNVQLPSGTTTGIAVSCPISSNTLGTGFKGILWIRYDNPTQSGVIDKIGVVSAKVATSGSSLRIVSGTGSGSVAGPFSANGGTVSFAGGNEIHTFTSSGTFTVTVAGNVAVLVVGGGGGGAEGGGGGGGVVYNSNYAVTAQAYSITVGSGGGGGHSQPYTNGANGANSIFGTITAVGGGGGATNNANGLVGGSGGGAGATASGQTGGAATAGQGFAGGDDAGTGTPYADAGGGGAGAKGGNTVSATIAGAGGSGVSYTISGASVTYAGGGGGGIDGPASGTGGAGGSGGGGTGSNSGSGTGSAGTANTGGGGGGGGAYEVGTAGGTGGSGIVIISFNQLGNGTP